MLFLKFVVFRFGPRFPAMSSAYDLELRQMAKKVAANLGFESFVHEGVYSMQVGPMFETVTECRFLRMIGADCTGNVKFQFCF